MSNIEEIPFTAKYTDKITNKEVSLSAILTKNSSTSDTILLCHGMFGSKNSSLNLHLLSGLKNFWSVLRFDFEGNGDSSGEWSYADYEREVRNISDIIEYLKSLIRNPVILLLNINMNYISKSNFIIFSGWSITKKGL